MDLWHHDRDPSSQKEKQRFILQQGLVAAFPTKGKNSWLNQDGKRHHLDRCNSAREHSLCQHLWRWALGQAVVRHQVRAVPPRPALVHQVVAQARRAAVCRPVRVQRAVLLRRSHRVQAVVVSLNQDDPKLVEAMSLQVVSPIGILLAFREQLVHLIRGLLVRATQTPWFLHFLKLMLIYRAALIFQLR